MYLHGKKGCQFLCVCSPAARRRPISSQFPETIGGLLHRHAPQQTVPAEGVSRALPAGAVSLPQPHPLLLPRLQPRRPQKEAGEDKE